MSQVKTPKAKTVDHYVQQNLTSTTPISQFWTASHKLLKNKSFTLKKLSFTNQNTALLCQQANEANFVELAKRQTNLLNQIKIEGVPKCHKLIRTTSNVYVVYESFSGIPLKEYLTSCKLSLQQRTSVSIEVVLELMISIAKQLLNFQQLGLIFFILSFDNIYVSENGGVIFVDWTFARKQSSTQKIEKEILGLFDGLPDFAMREGVPSFAVDIYCLGKVFEEITKKCSRSILSRELLFDLQNLIDQMVVKEPEDVISIGEIISSLEQIKANPPAEPQTPTFIIKDSVNKNGVQQKSSKLKVKKSVSENTPFHLVVGREVELSHNRLSDYSKKKDHSPSPRVESLQSLGTKSSKNTANEVKKEDQIGRRILKRRSLAFFLISLCQFMQPINPEISFLLLKKSREVLKYAINECEKLRAENRIESQTINILLQREILRVERLLQKLKTNLFEHNLVSDLKRQFTNVQSLVNLKFLHLKIAEFMKGYVSKMQKGKSSFDETEEMFYQFYMLTKTIECGSFELFWDTSFKKGSVDNSSYFQKQRKLGLRYFTSKIEETLKKII